MSNAQLRQKRLLKEENIIDAAEKVFAKVGFANTKMESIAFAAGVSKGTVYFYFDTKENLYMAVTYRAMQLLNDNLYRSADEYKESTGIDGLMAVLNSYLDFCEGNFFYSELLLDYMRLNRSSDDGRDQTKLTNALIDSLYYRKIQDVHNIPISIVTKEITRGVEDRSILNQQDPNMLYLIAWASVIGYIKLNLAAGSLRTTIHQVNIQEWKNYQMQIFKNILLNDI